jgi:hypothetical protein
VQMEDENNSNSVDPTSAVTTGAGNTTEDEAARSSLTTWILDPQMCLLDEV